MLHFLYPSDPFVLEQADPHFVPQQRAIAALGYSSSLISDAQIAGVEKIDEIPARSKVIYRGWMLESEEYLRLQKAVEQCHAEVFVSHKQYLATHHLPNWYPLISDFTPESIFHPVDVDIVAELQKLGWGEYFLKDFVKSLKTTRGSIVRDPFEATDVLQEIRKYRGEFEGGICVRRVEAFLPDKERRYFVVEGKAYAASESDSIPEIVHICSERIDSPFFSVDTIQRCDGELRIVEIGDGQVSDLVGWSAEGMARIWKAVQGVVNDAP